MTDIDLKEFITLLGMVVPWCVGMAYMVHDLVGALLNIWRKYGKAP
jgi:hypothetical protein